MLSFKQFLKEGLFLKAPTKVHRAIPLRNYEKIHTSKPKITLSKIRGKVKRIRTPKPLGD